MAEIIDGKKVSKETKEEIKYKVNKLKKEKGVTPGLAVILVGSDAASRIYVRNKEKACRKVGIYSEKFLLSEEVNAREILDIISDLNQRDDIHGILVQLPLPQHLDELSIISSIPPEKDVDGLHPENQGYLLMGKARLIPCTAAGIIKLLKYYDIQIEGANAVVVGRSDMVGKPVSQLLLKNNATVTVAHSRTVNLASVTKKADILVVAVGRPKLIKADMVKKGAVVIDVGINRVEGKLIGDVDFENISKKAAFITPVPGGVGLMTVTMLLENTLKACERQIGLWQNFPA